MLTRTEEVEMRYTLGGALVYGICFYLHQVCVCVCVKGGGRGRGRGREGCTHDPSAPYTHALLLFLCM